MKRDIARASGLFLALLAIVAQLTLAAAVPASAMSLADATVLCQHDTSAGTSQHRPPAHSAPDCVLCFFCHAASGPSALVATVPALTPPAAALIGAAVVLPPATAPPPRIILAARPRGPPILT